MINLQMLIQKNTFNVLSSCCPLKKKANLPQFLWGTHHLTHAKAWDLVL